MKSIFHGFYSTNDENLSNIWSSAQTLFVFDTNCLFNLYRCEDHTREDILGVMTALEARSWIPFQVGYEYQRGRRSIIEGSINSLSKIKSELQKIGTQNILSSVGIKKHLYNSLSDEFSDLQQEIKKSIDSYIESKIEPRIESKKSISNHDFIRDSIDSIILDKIGPIPTQEQIDDIDKQGKQRYDREQAPGFKDVSKESISYFSGIKLQDKYGDLYLWMQLIEKAKSEEIKNVIFVCDDNKPDWWYSISGKTHGPLESLKTEICRAANIENFRMISQITFLHEAKNNLRDIIIRDSSLKEVEELSNKPLITGDNRTASEEDENYWSLFFNEKNANSKTDVSKINKLDSIKYNHNEGYELLYHIKHTIGAAEKTVTEGFRILSDLELKKIELLNIIDSELYYKVTNSLKGNINLLQLLGFEIEKRIDGLNVLNSSVIDSLYNNIMKVRAETQAQIMIAYDYLSRLEKKD
ncbi:hypothetical protein SAMN04487787_101595 [Kosakonia sacchari]|nr:hypothetical protein SAMN04487787_101595 [Kosakonia sacchari]